ncbi:neural cell adhesion molecule 1 [Diretmus argenteus]
MEIISSKLDVSVGENHLLLCKAGGDGTITWKKDGEDIDDEERVQKMDETASKLLFKNIKMEDAGRYTCLCEFDNGHEDQVSIQLFVYDGPSFGSTNTYHEFLEGKDGVMPCLVSGQPAVEVHWLRDHRELPSYGRTSAQRLGLHCEGARIRKLPDNSLRIEEVKREDAGTYVCQAAIKGRPISQKLSISMVVNAPPTVRLREEVKRVMAGPEVNVSMVCLVDGLPKPNITWNMPVNFDPSHHRFNSDSSELTIWSVTRADYGEYICTAKNKIAEASAIIMLHVSEAPEVYLSVEKQSVSVGKSVSVSCNISGHPQPELHWLDKHNGHTLDSSGHVRVMGSLLVIDAVAPSDGGLYSCMAVSPSGNASRDFALYTQPGQPQDLSVTPGPTSVIFSIKTPPISGGTPITSFTLQWRRSPAEQWNETTVPASVPLAITSLKPYTSYKVRLAALNAVGLGQFSGTHTIRTQGIREPDSPVLSSNQIRVEGNSFSVPFTQLDNGGTPLLHFNIRYRQNIEGAEWKEKQLTSNVTSVSLRDLAFSSDYQLEVSAVNANGSSSAAKLKFTIPQQPVKVTKPGVTKGGVVGIVMVIFLVLLVAVDVTCCYKNRCGLLMFIAVKLFGQKVPGLKTLEEGEGTTNG